MVNKAGVWIDHREAVVVLLGPAREQTIHVASNVEKHLERDGDSPLKGSFEARQVPPDDRRQMALTGKLNTYFDAVIHALREVDSMLIFGPGEAKGEFKKRLVRQRLDGRVAGVETVDKMTDRQIAARTREFFGEPAAAESP